MCVWGPFLIVIYIETVSLLLWQTNFDFSLSHCRPPPPTLHNSSALIYHNFFFSPSLSYSLIYTLCLSLPLSFSLSLSLSFCLLLSSYTFLVIAWNLLWRIGKDVGVCECECRCAKQYLLAIKLFTSFYPLKNTDTYTNKETQKCERLQCGKNINVIKWNLDALRWKSYFILIPSGQQFSYNTDTATDIGTDI